MSEEAILELFFIQLAGVRDTLQWWASVSFGLIALGYFAGSKLKLPVVVLLCALYIAFTAFIADHFVYLQEYIGGHFQELVVLRDAGGSSLATQSVVTSSGLFGNWTVPIFVICFCGTFLGTLWYLVYSYRQFDDKESKPEK